MRVSFKTAAASTHYKRGAKTLVALAISQTIATQGASAASITVNDGSDVSAVDALCTFREATLSFNSAALIGGCINSSSNSFGVSNSLSFSVPTVNLVDGEVLIDADLDIVGGGVVIEGNPTNRHRLIFIDRGVTVSIDSATLSGGSVSSANRLGYGGGLLVDVGSTLTLTNSTVSGNTATRGGGLRASYAELNVVSSTFSTNTANYRGGAIDHRGNPSSGNLTITGGIVSNNSAVRKGGGISVVGAGGVAEAEIHGVEISYNQARTFSSVATGGGIFASDATLTIDSASMVRENLGYYGGGGVEIETGSLTISNSTIQNNSAGTLTSGGGGILVDRSNLLLETATITQNSASYGGGIAVSDPLAGSSTMTASNSSISYNVALIEGGGGIGVRGGNSVTLTNTQVTNNTSNLSGGGLAATDSEVRITGGAFSNNLCTPTSSPNNNGGALYARGLAVDASKVYIDDVTIANNTAGDAGALEFTSTYGRISGTTISGNNGRFGGGIRLSSNSDLQISESSVSNNFGRSTGGGILTGNSTLVVSNSTIAENMAVGSGNGAAAGIEINSSIVTLINATITDNETTTPFARGAGVESSSGSELNISNSLISGNKAAYEHSQIKISGTVMTSSNNLFGDSSETNALAFSPQAEFYIDSSDLVATSDAGSPLAIDKIRLKLANNGGPTKTVGLPTGSQAIDAGDNAVCAAAPINDVDQRGETRPDGSACDIGAFEGSIDGSSPFVIPTKNGGTVIIDL